jgi:hypothetical protein
MLILINDKSFQNDFRFKTPIVKMKENYILEGFMKFCLKLNSLKVSHLKMLKILFTRTGLIDCRIWINEKRLRRTLKNAVLFNFYNRYFRLKTILD